MAKTTIFILKKDLPTINAGRVIELSMDGKMGFPKMMELEKSNVSYGFHIDVLRGEKDWFEETEFDPSKQPTMVQE